MIVFADNDILLKLAGCNLLRPFCEIIQIQHSDVFVTPDAKFSIPSQAKKKLRDANSIQQLHSFLDQTQILSDAIPEHNILDELLATENIDGGEAQLILSAHLELNCKLATGDKRCLQALIKNQNLQVIANSLVGRVYNLEIAMLMLIAHLGYDQVNHSVSNRCVDDGTLNLAFGIERNVDHAIGCLSSYCRDCKPLLAESHLIVPESI